MQLTIDRKRWLRGECAMNSRLLRASDNKMCCLGFLCLAAGFTEDDIRNTSTPGYLRKELPDELQWMIDRTETYGGPHMKSSKEAGHLMTMNDTDSIDETAREQMLMRAFARQGITVEFVG